MIRRIGKYKIKTAGVHIPETIRNEQPHAAHTIPLRIPTRGFHRHRIGIGHENIFFSGDLGRNDADNTASAAQIHYAHTRFEAHMRKHREGSAINVLGRKQALPGF